MNTYGTRSRDTVDRALRELVASGLVTKRHGSGIFVHAARTPQPRDLRMPQPLGPAQDLQVTVEQCPASGRVAELLAVESGTALLHSTVRTTPANGGAETISLYLPWLLAHRAGLTDPAGHRPADEQGTLDQLRAAGITVDSARVIIEARMASAAEIATLGVHRGVPVNEIWRVLHGAGHPVAVSLSIVPADNAAYVLDVDLVDDACE